MKTKKIFIFMLAILAVLTAGCKIVTQETKTALTNVDVLLDWVPNTNHTGMYVAKNLGYYKEEGLNVTILQPPDGGGASLIAAGQAEFGIGYQEDITYARTSEDPLPIKAVAAVIQNNTSGFASLKSSGLKSPMDFENKRYGGWGSPMEEAMIKEIMEKNGADFKSVQMVNIGTTDFFQALQKDIDFAWIYYGWDKVAAETKGIELEFIPLIDLDPVFNFYTPIIYTSEEMTENDPQLVRKFLSATAKGYEYCVENPEDAARILTEEVGELDFDIVLSSQKYLAGEYIKDSDKWGYMKEEIWRNYTNWMYENDLIDAVPDINEAFTNEYLP